MPDDDQPQAKRGRKPLHVHRLRRHRFPLSFSDAEGARWRRCAARTGTTLSDWARTLMNRAADELSHDPGPPAEEDDDEPTPPTGPPPGE